MAGLYKEKKLKEETLRMKHTLRNNANNTHPIKMF
jgi:hypothetical protein